MSKEQAASEDSDDDGIVRIFGVDRVLQVLAIRANFPIDAINGWDMQMGRAIYRRREGEAPQEEGMVDLIPMGPGEVFSAYGCFGLQVFHSTTTGGGTTTTGEEEFASPIKVGWGVCDEDIDEPEEYTQTVHGGPGRMLEITYLLIPEAIEAGFEVRLKLKELVGYRSRVVYGKIKASAADYGNKSVHLFNCERGGSWSVPSGSSSILPLRPSVIALPYRRHLELHLEVDLTLVTISDNQQEEEKKFKFTGLKLTHRVRSQEREVGEDHVEVNIKWNQIPI